MKKENSKSKETATTLQLLKQTNPQVTELLDELKQIKLGLYALHDLKLQHRKNTPWPLVHCCKQCKVWSRAQEHLRRKRTEICTELQKLSYGSNPMELLEEEEK